MKTIFVLAMMLPCLVATVLVPRFALAGTNDRVPTLNSSASAAIPPTLVAPPSDCSQTLTGPKSDDYEYEASEFPSPSWFDYDDCLTPPLSSQRDFEAQERAAAPGPFDLSEYMIGDVAVTVIFPESSGSIDSQTETWSSARMDNCISEIVAGLTWWENREPRANLNFNVYSYGSRSTGYEPIRRPSTDDDLWIGEILTGLGFTSDTGLDQVAAVNSYVRDYYQTDWAFAIFVVDSYNDSDGEFSDGWFAYAARGGPYAVLTYDNDGYGIANMDVVAAHESGHIFWATDEYNGETQYSGYLNRPDSEGANCIMAGQVNWNLCSATRGQLGWVDTDGDNILDPLDTSPNTILHPYLPNPTNSHVLSYFGTVIEVPLPNNNPNYWSSGVAVSLNTITAVQYRIDNGSWYAASSVDGAFDEGGEEFTFTTPPLPDGSHLVQTRAQNSAGNWESSYSADTILVETNPTMTISTTGLVPGYPATVHYWQSGAAKTATTYGVWSSVVDRGSIVSIDNAVAVSSTERYSTNAATLWTANSTATYSVTYYHQFSTGVSVATAGAGHTDLSATNYVALTYYQFGSAMVFHLFDVQSFSDWIDMGSIANLANPSSGSTSAHRWYCPGTISWTVSSAGSRSVTYWDQVKPSISVVTAGTSHTDLDATNFASLTYYLFGSAEISEIFDSQSFNDWVDTGSTASLPASSSGSASDQRWYAPDAPSWVVSDASSRSVTYYEECQLSVSVLPSDATSASGSGWYEKGQSVNLVVPDLVDSGTGVRYVFASWNVDGNRVNARSISVKVDNPQLAEAMYITQCYLDVQSVRGNPQGSGWYDSGSEAAISVESPVGSIVRQVFVKWSGASSGYIRDLHITVDSPRTVTAEWRTDYTQLYILIVGILLVGLVAAAVIILVLRRQRHARLQM